ncbi:HpcH/HpaI aldolase/citrate lyase family protein [Falsarthrobacter nasiphocae]|uniref:4-hydroxy-2-oxoheptanedioate aldolase n=1 Tax=Falsarthrobacter nasiphocae TaxID=189863 RepID=A0AAE4C5C4_9MICC|nr:HpcH/HpaI aldolase/citrate lyase family protein [Falsarthrobacter nasiphocae]MDR6891353.1 4-hydroxy-2-oxoheptanedioate aldolase [Falsarthrobacter nasiphocae]
MQLRLSPTLRDRLASADRPLAGMWVCSGSPLVAEICAGSGLDWLLIDMEHSPNGLEAVLAQLQAVAAYPITPVVRVPFGDTVTLKQVLDLGAQTVLVPMVESAAQARELVADVRYPPLGRRGVGSALARSARWNRVDDYLLDAAAHVSLFVQVESAAGVAAAGEIAAVDGVDGVFVGPSDLAASMGLLGQQTHPDVVAAVRSVFAAVRAAGKPVGVNAFDPEVARGYAEDGAAFLLVGADVALLARGSEGLAASWARAAGIEIPGRSRQLTRGDSKPPRQGSRPSY